MKKTFELNIITPINTFSFDEVEYLRAPSIEGLFGVMKGHIPSIIALDIGEIKIIKDNKEIFFSTSGGFADINDNKVVLVLETVEEGTAIDLQRAEESLEKSIKYLNDKSSDINRAMDAIKRAKNRIAISKKIN
tara:strand:- start:34 stop:435 length:402 start_codon:yes stop_codon:yes gene_type:complete